MILKTNRLILRPVTPEDAQDIYEYSREPNVGPNAGWKPHASLEETREVMKAVFLGQEGVFGILPRESGRVVGTLGLVPDPKRQNDRARMLGYALGQGCWGRGYMTEAARALLAHGFGAMGLELVSAYCYPQNHRSARVLEKLGFRPEGRLRRSERLYDGRVLDELCFSLRPEELAAAPEEDRHEASCR